MEHTTAVHGTDVKSVVTQCIHHAVEEFRNLLVGFPLHAFENLFDQMRLVPSAGLDDQFAGRGTLIGQFVGMGAINSQYSHRPPFCLCSRISGIDLEMLSDSGIVNVSGIRV